MCAICSKTYSRDTLLLNVANCNEIRELPIDMPNLKYLCMFNTNIKSIPKYDSLVGLYMSDTKVTQIPPECTHLRKIMADNTPLTCIPDTFVKLEQLYISGTNIKNLPNTLINLENLEIDNSIISKIPKEFINLHTLSCRRTRITQIDDYPFLIELYCSYNNIKNIDIKKLPRLKSLECIGCPIRNPDFGNIDCSM